MKESTKSKDSYLRMKEALNMKDSPSEKCSNDPCYNCDSLNDRDGTTGVHDDCFIHQWSGYLKLYEKEVDPIWIFESVGRGWHNLLNKLIGDLKTAGWDGNVHQVKEKFGALRFYIGGGSDEIFDLIQEAENKSITICEECGEPGKVSGWGGYWMKSLCDEHGKQFRKGTLSI